jgi:o-succinylbenzoate synthase
LPSSGEEGFARAFSALRDAATPLVGQSLEAARASLGRVANSEARWALETALLDVFTQRRRLTLRRALSREAPDAVRVNAALGPLDDQCVARADAALTQGFEIAKIKVGVLDVDEEAAQLRELSHDLHGRLRFRLDANRAWSTEEAERFFASIAGLPIDGVEEPLAEPSLPRLAALQKSVPFAVAIDESICDFGPEQIFASRPVRRLVLKPARIGGFGATLQLAERARSAGMEVIVTSVVDSAIGVAAAAQLAAALGGNAAHGLATGDWLAEDVAPPLSIEGGRMLLPGGGGLGIAPAGEFA